jgi:hypothetical protein
MLPIRGQPFYYRRLLPLFAVHKKPRRIMIELASY